MRPVPEAWRAPLRPFLSSRTYRDLTRFVDEERERGSVWPRDDDLFAALESTPPTSVSVVILGQDPYPTAGNAHGLAFSVPPGVRIPASLKNVFRELESDLKIPVPSSGDLRPWARQGVLLLNTVLTVREGEANSHARRGWEQFTSAVVTSILEGQQPVVFLLWGLPAQKLLAPLVRAPHVALEAAHPSPLARGKFFGSRPFSRANAHLRAWGRPEIDWRLP
ncbi:MAG: uracil-DNA glycosylase [Planctomycetes bacterium]|nr:uracil-DNA glycosylase [Planctomycetota bacterium]